MIAPLEWSSCLTWVNDALATQRRRSCLSAITPNLLQNDFAPLREEQFSKSNLEQGILIHETVV
jgi:hypothetical protein